MLGMHVELARFGNLKANKELTNISKSRYERHNSRQTASAEASAHRSKYHILKSSNLESMFTMYIRTSSKKTISQTKNMNCFETSTEASVPQAENINLLSLKHASSSS
jgi:hypothetical protein